LQGIPHVVLPFGLTIKKPVDVVIGGELINRRLIIFIFIALDYLRALKIQICMVAMVMPVSCRSTNKSRDEVRVAERIEDNKYSISAGAKMYCFPLIHVH
jgi:hypothetical protein